MLFREKDNPERRYDYLDEMIGTIGKGTLGLTVNCARCHNHKFDPIPQKDYYALEASLFGYVETDVPLAPKAEADGLRQEDAEIDAQIAALARRRSSTIEQPYRDAAAAEQIKQRVPGRNVQQAIAKPETRADAGRAAARRPGHRSASRLSGKVDRIDDAGGRRARSATGGADRALDEGAADAAADGAEIVTDGDYRFIAARRRRRHDQLSEVPHPATRLRAATCTRAGPLPGAAVVFPDSRRRREPRARR